MLVIAVLSSIALLPAIYDIFTEHSLVLVWAVIFSCMMPVVFGVALHTGWKSIPQKIRNPDYQINIFGDPPSLSALERFLAIWLAAIVFFFLVWLIVQSTTFLSNHSIIIWWAIFASIGAIFVGALGYKLGSVRIEDNRKVGLYLGVLFSLGAGFGLIINIWINPSSSSLKFWSGLLCGLAFSLVTIWYMQKRWDPIRLAPKNQTITEVHLDALLLNNCFARGFLYLSLLVFFLFITSFGTEFASNFFLIWIAILFGYMSFQVYRHRPKQ